MSKTIQQKVHQQHRKWQSDREAWLIDLDEWRKELRTAFADLRDVEDGLRDSLNGLEVHADALWEEGQRLRGHELALGKETRAGERKRTDRQWGRRSITGRRRSTSAWSRPTRASRSIITP